MSASVNQKYVCSSPDAASTPWCRAQTLPAQPSGLSFAVTTRNGGQSCTSRAAALAASAVPSELLSSTR